MFKIGLDRDVMYMLSYVLFSVFHVDISCVMDLSFIRTQPQYLLVCSGHNLIALWDIVKQVSVQRFIGHRGSVKALSVSDDSPGWCSKYFLSELSIT